MVSLGDGTQQCNKIIPGKITMEFRISDHAKRELVRRNIPKNLLESILKNPQQVVPESGGRKAYQSQVDISGKIFLLRAIVIEEAQPAVVVTVYRTTKVSKYWRIK